MATGGQERHGLCPVLSVTVRRHLGQHGFTNASVAALVRCQFLSDGTLNSAEVAEESVAALAQFVHYCPTAS